MNVNTSCEIDFNDFTNKWVNLSMHDLTILTTILFNYQCTFFIELFSKRIDIHTFIQSFSSITDSNI